jgi:hypothetical protein
MSTVKPLTSFLVLAALLAAGAPAAAVAQSRTVVGGHIGLATPLLTITSDEDTDISETFVLVAPIGVTVKLSERLAIDFETQVVNPIDPRGETSLVVAPGAIFNVGGPFAAGLRVASAIGSPANVGVIPLLNWGLFPVGQAKWFVEVAFPVFFRSNPDPDTTFDFVLHTGLAF